MEAFASYLLKSALWLSGFALVYFLFLRNERYFMLKRIYLISGILIAFLFPLISVHYNVELQAPGQPIAQEFSNAAGSIITAGVQQEKAFHLDYRLIILFIYLAGIIYMLLRAIGNFKGIFRAIRESEVTERGIVRIIKATQFKSSFSFFNYVFINSTIGEEEAAEIMNHEIVHVRQRHWFDLLLVEILRTVQWVNPFAWIYTGYIRLNHEYLADQAALQRSVSPANYRAALMNQLFESPVISLSNSFNYSLNKKRFDMMKQKITSPWRKTKVLFVLPVIALLLYAFATPRYIYSEQHKHSGSSENNTFQDKISDSIVINQNVLILVNGAKMDKASFTAIDPDKIKTIDALKGDAAIAAYGDKGKNGVLVVTLKPEAKLANQQDTTKPKAPQKTSKSIMPPPPPPPPPPPAQSVTSKSNSKEPRTVVVVPQSPDRPVFFNGKLVSKPVNEIVDSLGHDFGTIKPFTEEQGLKKYGDAGKNGGMELLTRKQALDMGLKVPYNRIFPEDYPTFHGEGTSSFNEWVISSIRYPADAKELGISGKVYVHMSVEMDGSLSNVSAVGNSPQILAAEVLKVIQSAPKWAPPKNTEIDEPFKISMVVKFTLPDKVSEGNEPFVVVEEMPLYPGGEGALLQFIKDNIKYPVAAKEQKLEGRVIIRFVINSEGNAEDIYILRGVNKLLDDEAVRVVGLLKGFKPGMQGGKAVDTYFMVPVTFSLAEQKPEVSGSSEAEIRK
jgi:TonB family protein